MLNSDKWRVSQPARVGPFPIWLTHDYRGNPTWSDEAWAQLTRFERWRYHQTGYDPRGRYPSTETLEQWDVQRPPRPPGRLRRWFGRG